MVCSSYTEFIHDFILQAGIFMGFAITSAVFGGIIIILYSITMAGTSCQDFCLNDYSCGGGGHPTLGPSWDITYSYDTKLGLAAVILTLGIIEFGTGIWVSICLCVIKPCCKNLEVSFLLSKIQSARLKVPSQTQT